MPKIHSTHCAHSTLSYITHRRTYVDKKAQSVLRLEWECMYRLICERQYAANDLIFPFIPYFEWMSMVCWCACGVPCVFSFGWDGPKFDDVWEWWVLAIRIEFHGHRGRCTVQGSGLMHLHDRYWPLYLHVCVFVNVISSFQPTSNLRTDTPGKACMTGHPTYVPTKFYGWNKNIAFV